MPEPLDHTVAFVVTKTEFAALERAAAAEGKDFQEWCRRALVGSAEIANEMEAWKHRVLDRLKESRDAALRGE